MCRCECAYVCVCCVYVSVHVGRRGRVQIDVAFPLVCVDMRIEQIYARGLSLTGIIAHVWTRVCSVLQHTYMDTHTHTHTHTCWYTKTRRVRACVTVDAV